MKYTRRDFIKYGKIAFFAVGAMPFLAEKTIGQSLASLHTKSGNDTLLIHNADSFQKLVGSEFTFYQDNSTVSAELTNVKISKPSLKNPGENFSLDFEMPSADFEQNTYKMFHPTIGYFELLSVPGKQTNGKSLLIAVINRL